MPTRVTTVTYKCNVCGQDYAGDTALHLAALCETLHVSTPLEETVLRFDPGQYVPHNMTVEFADGTRAHYLLYDITKKGTVYNLDSEGIR